LWAQRSNKDVADKNLIYLTVNILDAENTDIQLSDEKLEVASRSEDDNISYAVTLQFYQEIDSEKSTRHRTDRGLFFVLRKKVAQEEYWPRLTKVKHPYVKTDFDKWVDEDEQDPQANEDFGSGMGDLGGGFDLIRLTGGQGGMPDMSAFAGAGAGAFGDDEEEYDEEEEAGTSTSQDQKIQEIE
jgi:hypothetical protein